MHSLCFQSFEYLLSRFLLIKCMYYYDLLLTANGFINQRIFLDSCRNGSSRSLGSQAQISSTKFICYQCSSILTHCTRNYYTIVPSCCVSSSISSITITTTKPLKMQVYRKICSGKKYAHIISQYVVILFYKLKSNLLQNLHPYSCYFLPIFKF